MESGVYCGPAPLGYTKKGKSMGTTYIINEDGKLLAKAFRWKLQGMTNNQIIEKLKTYGLVLCPSDERPLTHYTNKKKHIDYYKCTRKGCCTNISAKILHKKYAEWLGTFGIPTALYDVVRQMIERLIDADSEDRVQRLAVLRKQRTECNNRLKKAKLR